MEQPIINVVGEKVALGPLRRDLVPLQTRWSNDLGASRNIGVPRPRTLAQRIAQYELGSPDWMDRVKASKFDAWKGYGRSQRGRIALQDHGDVVSFRNIRIRVLP